MNEKMLKKEIAIRFTLPVACCKLTATRRRDGGTPREAAKAAKIFQCYPGILRALAVIILVDQGAFERYGLG